MNDKKTNTTETSKIAFEYSKKDIAIFTSGVLSAIGSILGFNKIKKSESKSKKLLWSGATVLSVIGAIKSLYSLSDSLLLPEADDIEYDED